MITSTFPAGTVPKALNVMLINCELRLADLTIHCIDAVVDVVPDGGENATDWVFREYTLWGVQPMKEVPGGTHVTEVVFVQYTSTKYAVFGCASH
jgi:hypothetical protein